MTPSTAAGNGTQVRTTFPTFLYTPIPFRAVKAHYDGMQGFFVFTTTCPSCWHKGEGLVDPSGDYIDRMEKLVAYMHSDTYKCRTCRENEAEVLA